MIAGERATRRIRAVHARREPDDHERCVGRTERRHRAAAVRGMLGTHCVEERGKTRAATAIGIVRGGGAHFWQNGDLAGGGTHGARIVARARSAPRGGHGSRVIAPRAPISRSSHECCLSSSTSNSARACPRATTAGATAGNRRCFSSTAGTPTPGAGTCISCRGSRARAIAAHALSLRGHGESGGHESLIVAGLDDYAADVEHVVSRLPSAPVLIGHSMGAAVVERLLATRPVRAAVLLAPVPPAGLVGIAARLAAERPDTLLHMMQFDPTRMSSHVLETLRPYYFSDDVDAAILAEATRHLGIESPRVLLDLALRLHWQLPERGSSPVLVMGAEGDRICTPDDVRATARHHGVDAAILPGLAHMLMLERGWETPARELARWLETLDR